VTAAFRPGEASFVAPIRVGYLATISSGGKPHVVPVSPVLDGDGLVFASERDTRKVRNIERHPDVAICFDEYDEDWSRLQQVVAHGRARVIGPGSEFERGRSMLYVKYPQYEREAPITETSSVIVGVRVERVVSWGI
jgi:PPOX class probable F420-dependent enzyme